MCFLKQTPTEAYFVFFQAEVQGAMGITITVAQPTHDTDITASPTSPASVEDVETEQAALSEDGINEEHSEEFEEVYQELQQRLENCIYFESQVEQGLQEGWGTQRMLAVMEQEHFSRVAFTRALEGREWFVHRLESQNGGLRAPDPEEEQDGIEDQRDNANSLDGPQSPPETDSSGNNAS